MFLMVSLDRLLLIEPKELNANLQEAITKKLCRVTKGTCSAETGYIIDIIDVQEIGDGLVLDTSGDVQFNIKYTALVFLPKKGDVYDGVVSNISQNSIIVSVGPQTVVIAESLMPSNVKYDPFQKCYKSEDMTTMIEKDSEIRFRLIGVSSNASEITCAGTINEPYLGPLK